MMFYTAEDSAGEIVCMAASPGYGRDDFVADVLKYVRAEDGDAAPHGLDLYEWENAYAAGVWLQGVTPLKGQTWPTMARQAKFGEIIYVYPGEYEVRAA